MFEFPLARLPYCYALSPLSTNEIPLAMSLLNHVRQNDLILMDRGFFSYGMFWAIQKRNAFFAIRLKAGVRLETIRSLGATINWCGGSPVTVGKNGGTCRSRSNCG